MLFSIHFSTSVTNAPHLKKRKLEPHIEHSFENMHRPTPISVAPKRPSSKDEPVITQNDSVKRRKRSQSQEQQQQTTIPVKTEAPLPQKKRVVPTPKKPTRDEQPAEDNEALIRETQAALKSLSGSWPDSKSSYSRDPDESPDFENLFEEKKSKMSPVASSASSSASDACSLKDVITLRKGDAKRYDPPDFNELVDDSSDALEIDMSEQADDDKVSKRRSVADRDGVIGRHHQSLYASYAQRASGASAFKPPADSKRILTAFPPETAFEEDKSCVPGPMPLQPAKLEPDDMLPKTSVPSVASPGASKQYTILQPAGVGSRAASAIQDVAREGVVSVAAVSSSCSPGPTLSDASTVPVTRPTQSLSPGSINRGIY